MRYSTPTYGQLVIGPPGAGKTTYCHRIHQLYAQLERSACVVNLDPANEQMEYAAGVDIMQLITVADVMESHRLGPNGALMYCMEFLEQNFDWLLERLRATGATYFVFDCPGQVELYTHHRSMAALFARLEQLGYLLCTVLLIDSHHCAEPAKFVSTLMLSLNTMLQMGLPHVSVLSKADLFRRYDAKLQFGLEFYTEVLDLEYLLQALDETPGPVGRLRKLNRALVGMVEDYGLVSFQPLDVNSQASLMRLRAVVDKANGFVYGAAEERSVNAMLACAVGAESGATRAERDYTPYLDP